MVMIPLIRANAGDATVRAEKCRKTKRRIATATEIPAETADRPTSNQK
jgi:hypothetical protein